MKKELFVTKGIAFFIGCLACYSLQEYLHLSAVASAAAVGFIGSFLHFPKFYEKKGLHAAIYSGAFAGMCSRDLLPGTTEVVILSVIGGIFYVLSRPYANGFGGRLGTIAFLSSLCFYLLRGLL